MFELDKNTPDSSEGTSYVEMLKNGVTMHDEDKRNYYLREYREKLRK